MKFIIGARQSGKTTKILKIAEKKDLIIVTANHAGCEYLKRTIKDKELKVKDPITWNKFFSGRTRDIKCKGYIIEDLECCLSGMGVKVATMSTDEKMVEIEFMKNWKLFP